MEYITNMTGILMVTMEYIGYITNLWKYTLWLINMDSEMFPTFS
jgi:beta-lactamase regulating signal transducer with metallopeptidase domain